MEVRGERVLLRPLAATDVARLAELAGHPEVARWWPGLTEPRLRELLDGNDATPFAIFAEDALAGLIQYWEEDDPEFRHAGIDLFLGVEFHGRGLGGEAVRALALHLVHARGHHRLVIDPPAANGAAIRCYERVGFRRVGVLREYWRDVDGVWRDGLLLDLLASELE